MGKHSSQKKRKKLVLKNPKKLLIFLSIIIILVVAIRIKNNNKIKNNFELSLVINNQDVTKQLEDDVVFKQNTVFLSFEDMKKCLDYNIYIEDKNILMSSDKKIASLQLNSDNLEINGSTIKIKDKAFKNELGTIYIPISELKNVYDIEFSYIPEYKNIVIDNYSKKSERAETTKNVAIREHNKNSSIIIEKLNKGASIVFISEQNGWAKVKTQNGNIGYAKMKYLTNFKVEREEFTQESKEVKEVKLEKDITNSNIKKYENRKQLIEQIILEAVNKKQRAVKIIYKKDKEDEKYKRFIIEATAILKESGITLKEN